MLEIINPSNEEVINTLKSETPQNILKKAKTARSALFEWKSVSLDTRVDLIKNFQNLLRKNLEDCAKTLTQEMGKPLEQARAEIKATDSRIQFFLDNTKQVIQDKIVFENKNWQEHISYEPLGTIANISAWNFPYFVGSNVFIPALLTGNTLLYKPSEITSLTGLKIAELMHKAGVPDSVFQVLIGRGNVGAMLIENAVDGIFFTGSATTGKKIATQVAHRLITLGLELGGKDPAYVCEDVDIESTAENLVEGSYYNAGQSCCAVERIYVHENIWKKFNEAFLESAKKWTTGDPLNSSTMIGPLARKEQREVLNLQIEDAIKKGAKTLLKGGKANGPGWFFNPGVYTEANHEMTLMREESFGPIIGIQKVSNDNEAIDLINDTKYGLTASVHSKDKERAIKILSKANTGTVYWNSCDRISPYLPWSGRKDSGIGSTLSEIGITTMLKPKAWHLKKDIK